MQRRKRDWQKGILGGSGMPGKRSEERGVGEDTVVVVVEY